MLLPAGALPFAQFNYPVTKLRHFKYTVEDILFGNIGD